MKQGLCGDCDYFVAPTEEARAEAEELSKKESKEVIARGQCGRYPPQPVPHIATIIPLQQLRVVNKNRLEREPAGFVLEVTGWGSAVPRMPEAHPACGEFKKKGSVN